ncbi:MAG: hypothetical protein KatS3mg082_1738 [Nitrospiraceae bacterium]|nr:MAG: hypothetical protein KatS3mg082_1738 [Nitrospiraceae bacterium]
MLGFGIREKTTTTGTGNLTLVAETGYPRFSNVFPVNVFFYYSVLDANNKPIEHGIGYLSDANTLVRSKIIATYEGGIYDDIAPAAANLAAGDKFVICTPGQASALLGAPGLNSLGSTTKGVLGYSQAWSISTGAVGNGDQLIVWPFRLEIGIECDAAGIRVSTAESGKTAKFALYTCEPDGWAGAKLRECSFDIGTVGNKYSTWTSGGNISSPARLVLRRLDHGCQRCWRPICPPGKQFFTRAKYHADGSRERFFEYELSGSHSVMPPRRLPPP